ncbi:hypothetical protein [Pseudoroseomonas cervicalis]|uniref:hypothetical protein n=1 Tax=Teichococcus cervicalis TaxID=204525 RepID=UPI0027801F3D|nr:hypothetical protein [Pseudoroseomonas cervicalis]MDQ1079316.1 hypothetical protein [Pseudoroseomonas cervicalis]
MEPRFPPPRRPLVTLPPGQGALRRFGGFALLGVSLWLVSLLALFRALVELFD